MSVKTVKFFLWSYTESNGFIDCSKDNEGHNSCESTDCSNTDYLNTDKLDTAHTIFCKNRRFNKYTSQNCSDHTTCPVNTCCTDRVVYFKNTVNKFNNENNCKTGNNTDSKSTIVGYNITSCCNTNETCKSTVHCHGNIRFTVTYPCEEESNKCCCSSCKVCCHGDITETFCGSCCGTAVKSEPAEPENKCT